jgi:hypothetical protein
MWMAHIHTERGFCSRQTQNAKVLKTVTDNWGSVVLSSRAGAHKSLIREKKAWPQGRGLFKTYEIHLYCWIRRKEVLSVSVCRAPTVLYIHKVLKLQTLLLKNGEIYNAWNTTNITFIFSLRVPLLYIEYLSKKTVLDAEILRVFLYHL